MVGSEQRYETPRSRTAWLLLAFALLMGVGVVTVLLPEIENEPSQGSTARDGRGDPSATR